MKMKISMLLLSGISLLSFVSSCKKEKDTVVEKPAYFLSDIRPSYFENLNFESEAVRRNISSFRESLYKSFLALEQQYRSQSFTSSADKENYRLCCQYFGFYTLALTAAYLDSAITIQDIQGDKPVGLFSQLPPSTPDFAFKEMVAMITKGGDIAYEGAYLNNSYNDKTYGFYIACVQLEKRLKNRNNMNDPATHRRVVDYAATSLVQYNLIPVWNLLMAQVTINNYADPLNTFDNPHLDTLFASAQRRLEPGVLPDLGGLYPEIFGPLYRFDLTMKKIDWYLKKPVLSQDERNTINGYLSAMNNVTDFIETKRTRLLNSWVDKNTYFQRKDKLSAIRSYFDNYNPAAAKPELASFINSKDFKRAYQCYSCHRPSGL
jgi:hypothetical protein